MSLSWATSVTDRALRAPAATSFSPQPPDVKADERNFWQNCGGDCGAHVSQPDDSYDGLPADRADARRRRFGIS